MPDTFVVDANFLDALGERVELKYLVQYVLGVRYHWSFGWLTFNAYPVLRSPACGGRFRERCLACACVAVHGRR